MHAQTTLIPASVPRAAGAPDRWLYVGLVAVMSVIVLAGFWPFYAGLITGGTRAHWVIYVHAAVFTGWMVLLAAQATLVLRRGVRMHQRLGRFGALYGMMMLVLGVAVTFVATADSVRAGRMTLDEAAGFLVLPVGDLLLFAGFFGAAILYRRRRELHKRLIVLATVALLFPPAARFGADTGMHAVLVVWLLPLAIAVAHDALTLRRVERVYLLGTVILLVAFARVALMTSEPWLVVGRAMLQPWL